MPSELQIMISDEDVDRRVSTRRAALRAQLEVAAEVGYGTKAISLALQTHPDVILVAVEEPVGRPLETAESLANVLPNTPIIIYSSINDPEAIRRAMLMGARDYILQPVQPDQLQEAMDAVLVQEERRQMRRSGQLLNELGRGTVVTVMGGKGGVGKTVVGVNLGLALWRETGMSVAIFDAHKENGDVTTLLDMTPDRTVGDLLPLADQLDRHNFQEFMTEFDGSVDVLAASNDEEVWGECNNDRLKHIIDLLAQTYDFVIIDIGASLGQLTRACVESSTLTLVVTSGEITSVRSTATALQRFEQWQIPADRFKLIFNQRARSDGMNAEELSAAVDRDIFWQVPYDHRIAVSVQMGQPTVLFDDSTAGARSLLSLARTVAGTKKPLAAQKKKSLFRRLNKR